MGRRRKDEPDPILLRGKYPAWRYPQLATFPDIDPGQYWEPGVNLPEGFRLDKSSRIWPIAVKRGLVAPDPVRCIGTTRSGERCPNWRMLNGKGLCRMHGGSQRQGIDHPKTVTGEQMRKGIFGDALPADLAAWYERAIEDPGIYDLTHNIALLTGRERQILKGLADGESRANWDEAAELCDKVSGFIAAGDTKKAGDVFTELRNLCRKGRSDTAIWDELRRIGESKRRLMDTERKRRMDLKMVVTADQLRAILRAFTIIVFEEVGGIPSLIQEIVHRDGKLDTGRLSMALTARIGKRMTTVSQGIKSGKLPDEE